jgi:hypothetical protein
METRIVLTLTQDEAAYLSALLGSKIIGSGDVRMLNTHIWNALASEAGEYRLTNCVGQVEITDDARVVKAF